MITTVNGPAIGHACSSVALYDFVYPTPQAHSLTPFARWAYGAAFSRSLRFLGSGALNGCFLDVKRFQQRRFRIGAW